MNFKIIYTDKLDESIQEHLDFFRNFSNESNNYFCNHLCCV